MTDFVGFIWTSPENQREMAEHQQKTYFQMMENAGKNAVEVFAAAADRANAGFESDHTGYIRLDTRVVEPKGYDNWYKVEVRSGTEVVVAVAIHRGCDGLYDQHMKFSLSHGDAKIPWQEEAMPILIKLLADHIELYILRKRARQ